MKWRKMLRPAFGLFLAAVLPSSLVAPVALADSPAGLSPMPPHPDLIDKLKEEGRRLPLFITDPSILIEKGIDQPTGSPLRPTGNYSLLALLVEFTDKFPSVAPVSFDTLIFAAPPANSVTDYYDEISYGTMTIVTVNLPSATGWNPAPRPYNGPAGYVNPDGIPGTADDNGFGSYPQNVQGIVWDLVALVDPFVNFAPYDNDADGSVDTLVVIHAGPGAEFTGDRDDVWSHMWALSGSGGPGPHTTGDGVNVDIYTMEPEYWQTSGDMTIGVYCHELGHGAFNLPDLYDRDYSSSGLGRLSLMAGGSWNGVLGSSPAHPDAWTRAQMGFLSPTVISVDTAGVSIPQIETTSTAYRLWTNGDIGAEYFLVENRQQTGYDASLPSNGLLIYHVDENVITQNDRECSQVNNWLCGVWHYLVALEQADGQWDLEHNTNSDAGDPYPGSTFNRTFDSSSVPNSSSYRSSQDTSVGMTDISNSGSTMTADMYVECAAGVALEGESTQSDLNTLRRFRDEVLAQSPGGRRYTKLYYKHSPEVVKMLLLNPSLRSRMAEILRELMPGIRGLLDDGPGQEIVLSEEMVEDSRR